ncbi:glycosyltransferase [Niabella aurantiaca]|uniref:glycosyltransferase n=1 Tax=Niabella aurantiaca TaxID=379900 RepID=UPI001FDFCED9|nr:glycosyltransferase [Niabella aurantiaca]
MKNNAGAHTRAWGLLEAFHRNGITVDYVHSEDTWGAPMSSEEREAMQQMKRVRNIYSLRRKPGSMQQLDQWLRYRMQRLWRDLSPRRSLPSFVTTYNQYLFNNILRANTYDYIVISYAHWGDLIKSNPCVRGAELIIDTHDFLTAQEQVWKKFDIGQAFGDEMKRLNYFDKIWAISAEEQYLFRQFSKKETVLVPFCTDDHTAIAETEKSYDILYVASDNRHNLKAADWFFREVYPLINPSFQWCVIGGIHQYIPDKENIKKIPYTDSLGAFYSRAKLAICPMLSGTGVKIKVIEALSYGLPVVCSPRGVDGLVNKTENGCIVARSATDFARAIQELLSMPDHYKKVSAQAGSFFQKNHTKETFFRIMTEALEV